nr:helix-turn-helix transcriptional regulator [Desulfobacula toluolica]
MGLVIKKGYNLIKAWRVHLGMTQKQVAGKAGITQAALSQMERTEQENKTSTLEKLALAMGLSVEQLRD